MEPTWWCLVNSKICIPKRCRPPTLSAQGSFNFFYLIDFPLKLSLRAVVYILIISHFFGSSLFLLNQFNRAPKDSKRRLEAQRQLLNEINSRAIVDNKFKQISAFLFGTKRGISMLHDVRPGKLPLVDDWSCLKTLVSQTKSLSHIK